MTGNEHEPTIGDMTREDKREEMQPTANDKLDLKSRAARKYDAKVRKKMGRGS